MNTGKNLRVGIVQHSCTISRNENLERSLDGIRLAASDGARLVLLQELHSTVYFCQNEETKSFALAEPVPGPTSGLLGDLARELGIVIVGSVFEKRADGLFHDTAVVLNPDGELAGIYRKTHIPDDPGYAEKFYFTPGDLGIHAIETPVGRLGVLVCWDQWYPEAARLMALDGAQLLLYPSAIGWDPNDTTDEKERQLQAWITVQRGHAIANHLPVLCCNRCGTEPAADSSRSEIEFWGSSFACGPQGEMLGQAGSAEQALIVDLDLGRCEELRCTWPFFRDRRIDLYGDLAKGYREHD
ncbi:MAG: carbon-nitrogen hydrolase [Proteobacteria bacterium]|nr:carbon-nitrogen hydrolase [Pseudomonadota bacterium]